MKLPIRFSNKEIFKILKVIKIEPLNVGGLIVKPFLYLYIYLKSYLMLKKMRIDWSNYSGR